MNLKTSSALLLIILLASCASPDLTPLASEAPSATSAPSKTPTPKPTNTPTLSPTPEVKLHGLITELGDVPTYTRAQELAHIQKAIDSRSLYQEQGDIWHIQISPLIHNDLVKGEAVRIICNLDKSCLIRDTYKVNVGTDADPLIVHKLLMEYFVTFEDGSRGSVIVPIVFDQQWAEPGTYPDADTWYKLQLLAKAQTSGTGVIDIVTILTSVKANSRPPTHPAIIALWDRAMTDPVISGLLEKMHTLSKEGTFLTQGEINILLDAFLW